MSAVKQNTEALIQAVTALATMEAVMPSALKSTL